MKGFLLPVACLIIAFVCHILGDTDPDITKRLAGDGVDGTATVAAKEKITDKGREVYRLNLIYDVPGQRRYEKVQEVSAEVWEAAAPQGQVGIRYSKENPEVLRVEGDGRGLAWRISSWTALAAGVLLLIRAVSRRGKSGPVPPAAQSQPPAAA